ncbi:MAG TPA: LysM peptidoglycan-binding domain-containing protein [Burkholderiales bacterium]|nr:LysM peptidoglycan-binding domain-containing protein [Burkholderiales bacterium]
MQKSITALLALLLAGAASLALTQGDLALQDNAPNRYIVQKGDTLWSIATKFLKDQWRWPEIWRMNQEQIRNPHLISPGDVLVLDRSVSPPQLRLGEDSGVARPAAGSVKLSPRIYGEPLAKEAIPAIPLKAIEPFLTQPLLIEEGGLDKAPRIIATEENRVNVGAGNVAYVSGFGGADIPVWQVYRAGRPLVDPDSRRTLGFEAVFLGTVRVTQSGEPATVQILDSKKEISAGDRLIPAPPPTIAQYVPHAPASAVNGRIMGLYDALATSVGGRDSIISINRGRRDGLEPGNVLAVYRNVVIYNQRDYLKSRDRSPAIQLPPERYGLVFIFRTFNSVSYALVMESSRPIQPGDLVLNP